MKYRYLLISLAALVVSCSVEEMRSPEQENNAPVFYATIDEQSDADTKVYADSQLRVLWNEDDRVTIFNKNTYNQQYRFTGEDGDNAGAFRIVPSDDIIMGGDIDKIYAVYPYLESTKISYDGIITCALPSEQSYKENSFGIGSNTMAAMADGNMLKFKNVGGYLSLKFYGEGVSVSSITLKSNNGELIAGECKVDMSSGLPESSMVTSNATDEITMTCETPVELGATADDAVQFIFVLSPVTMTGGFTVTVTTSDGGVFEKSSVKERVIGRSAITPLGAMKVVPNYDNVFVPFEDDNFKAYMVNHFDTNGDGEISYDEALLITRINVHTENIASVHGIEYCLNLQSLECQGSVHHYYDLGISVVTGLLSSLDVSNNTALTSLMCRSNQLTSLDVSNNTALEYLYCNNNQLTSLDVSNNTALKYLECDNTQLTSLDVSNNTALEYLYCGSNQLMSLDVSSNTALSTLWCASNQLTSLDVSNNIALKKLSCDSNQLTSLDVSSNTAMSSLACSYNQLTSLDVSNNIALAELSCGSNQLTNLDVSNNAALIGLWCIGNQLTSLDVSNNTKLTYLSCPNNQLASLDVSNNSALGNLICTNNPYLIEIWLQIGQTIEDMQYDTDIATIKYKSIPEAIDMGLPSGLKWASFNLGASAPEEYGDYYAWGETEPYYSSLSPLTWKDGKSAGYDWTSYKWCDGTYNTQTKYCTNSNYGTVDNKTVLEQDDDVAHFKLGGSWRMPTDEEWTELRDNCTWTWTTQNGVDGSLVTSNVNGNSIFLPAAGYRVYTSLSSAGSYGYYWSSSLNTDKPFDAWEVYFDSNSVHRYSYYHYSGQSVRPVKE